MLFVEARGRRARQQTVRALLRQIALQDVSRGQIECSHGRVIDHNVLVPW